MGTFPVKRKTAARRPAAKRAPAKRRRMGMMPATLAGKRRAPRKMRGKKGADVLNFAKSSGAVALGILGASFAPKVVSMVTDKPVNPHLINGLVGLAGYGIAYAMPEATNVGVGMASAALVNTAIILVPDIAGGAMRGGHTRKVRELSTSERAKLLESVKAAGEEMRSKMPGTLAGKKYDWAEGSVM